MQTAVPKKPAAGSATLRSLDGTDVCIDDAHRQLGGRWATSAGGAGAKGSSADRCLHTGCHSRAETLAGRRGSPNPVRRDNAGRVLRKSRGFMAAARENGVRVVCIIRVWFRGVGRVGGERRWMRLQCHCRRGWGVGSDSIQQNNKHRRDVTQRAMQIKGAAMDMGQTMAKFPPTKVYKPHRSNQTIALQRSKVHQGIPRWAATPVNQPQCSQYTAAISRAMQGLHDCSQ